MSYIKPVIEKAETDHLITPCACTSNFNCTTGFNCGGYTCVKGFHCSGW
ncbi:UNVERIFIED_CONTAM: hypothetical protein ABIC26_004225 [Paenibacillus sp. PvR008]